MGRTVPTITQSLNETEAMLHRFRRTLRRGDQYLLDDLLASAHRHIAAIAETQALLPFEGALLAILLEQARRLTELEQRLNDLEQALSSHDPR